MGPIRFFPVLWNFCRKTYEKQHIWAWRVSSYEKVKILTIFEFNIEPLGAKQNIIFS